MNSFRIGIVGAGTFARFFIPLFQAHPGIAQVILAEPLVDRRDEVAREFNITTTVEDIHALCELDIDAVAIFTQRHLHGAQTLHALQKGKHVYCAVPAAMTLSEITSIVQVVRQTGKMYMTGETSYYYPSALFCREKFRSGQFGRFVYGEGEYLHDMAHGFYEAFQHSGGPQWQSVAGVPPMYYPTHSTSMIISVTGETLTRVACLGYRDNHDDNIFGDNMNLWNNPFSNQTALFRTSCGGMARVNEFRRIAAGIGGGVRTSIFGTLGAFEQQSNAAFWSTHDHQQEDLLETFTCSPQPDHRHKVKSTEAADGHEGDFISGVSQVHPVHRLPDEFKGHANGHWGSHQFLVDDFVRAVLTDKLPPNHVWAAARYLISGLIAHESSLRDGQWMDIPDLGDPPAGSAYIEDDFVA